VLGLALAGAAQTAPRSTITIHVHKSGLFSGFGHNHEITAPVSRAAIDPRAMTAVITVSTKDMKVVDTDVSDKDRVEIQQAMLGPKVLDAEKFPEIRFTSSRIERTTSDHAGPPGNANVALSGVIYRVTGTLELHGVRKPLTFEVTGGSDRFRGKARLKQTDFGIEPVSVAGGTVKVKDEIDLDFDISAGENR
jgi:polyisoprenoid-binding protein YceI